MDEFGARFCSSGESWSRSLRIWALTAGSTVETTSSSLEVQWCPGPELNQ